MRSLALNQAQKFGMNETYTPPTILVVEEDDEVRPVLSQNLRHQGYHVVVALDDAHNPPGV
jgi:response regulator RpfG family c-di-GMP phosphodiesterase